MQTGWRIYLSALCADEMTIKVMAAIVRTIPIITLVVTGSPNAMAPTRMAVTGSNTPSTDALVAPMRRVATARVAVDTIVGRTASPVRLPHAAMLSRPASRECPSASAMAKNTADPTSRA